MAYSGKLNHAFASLRKIAGLKQKGAGAREDEPIMSAPESHFRERIREVLTLISSPADQLEYQSRVPVVNVAEELFNQWEDWFHPNDRLFRSEFSAKEVQTLSDFARVLDAIAEKTPQNLPPLRVFMKTDAWRELTKAAASTLKVLDDNAA